MVNGVGAKNILQSAVWVDDFQITQSGKIGFD